MLCFGENSLGIKVEEYNIAKVVRLRKSGREGRNRPVLIRFEDEYEKREILRHAKNLVESDPVKKSIGIAADITKKELEIDTKLWQERSERKRLGEKKTIYKKNGQLFKARMGREMPS